MHSFAGLLVWGLVACGDSPTSPADSGAAPAVASGWQRFSSLGLEVDAPADWPFNVWHGCSAPPPVQIERGQGAVAGCGTPAVVANHLLIATRMPEVEGEPSTPTDPVSTAAKRLPGGVTASVRRFRTEDGRSAGSLEVEGRQAYLEVSSPDESVVERVLASARWVEEDSVGCVRQLDASPAGWDRPAPGPAVRLTTRETPSALAVCHYQRVSPSDGAPDLQDPGPAVLSASALLTGQQLVDAVDSIERAQPGALPEVPLTQCLRTPERSPLWLHIAYPDQATVDVHVQYSSCGQRYTATPTGVSQVTEAQLKALLTPLSTGYGYSAPLPPT